MLFLALSLVLHSAPVADVQYVGTVALVHIKEKKVVTDFAVLSPDEPVKAQLSGPATLNIEVRAVLRPDQFKTRPVVVRVLVDNVEAKSVNVELKKAPKTSKAVFKHSDVPEGSVPSAPFRFTMPIDSGSALFELQLGGKEKSVLVAMSLAQPPAKFPGAAQPDKTP